MDSNGHITRLIAEWQSGNPEAEAELFEALYARLHQIAGRHVRLERPSATLSATALVHDAYLRLARSGVNVHSSTHLLRLSSRVMRQLLVDRARARRAAKRDRGDESVGVPDAVVGSDADAVQILSVHAALDQLERDGFKRQAQLVELRWFAGYSMNECARILGVPVRTLHRHWDVARLRLREAIDGPSQPS